MGRKRSGFRHSRLHLWVTVVWGVLLVPTMIWWRESLPWVVYMSWFANFYSAFSAYEASKAKEAAE